MHCYYNDMFAFMQLASVFNSIVSNCWIRFFVHNQDKVFLVPCSVMKQLLRISSSDFIIFYLRTLWDVVCIKIFIGRTWRLYGCIIKRVTINASIGKGSDGDDVSNCENWNVIACPSSCEGESMVSRSLIVQLTVAEMTSVAVDAENSRCTTATRPSTAVWLHAVFVRLVHFWKYWMVKDSE